MQKCVHDVRSVVPSVQGVMSTCTTSEVICGGILSIWWGARCTCDVDMCCYMQICLYVQMWQYYVFYMSLRCTICAICVMPLHLV